MGAAENIAIRTENLTKRYASGQTEILILDALNLQVREAESVAIIGQSGTGKSTLLHLLGGLDRPTSGRVYFGSKEVSSLQDAELSEFRNEHIGYVWQSHALLPEFSALENVMMPLLIRGISQRQASLRAREKMNEVGLSEREHHRAGELSGGEQQRVSLARALAANPKVLLADEPTGNLDQKTGESIIYLLEQLHRNHALTSVIVTHNVAFAQRCDRVLMLEEGQLRPFEPRPQPPTSLSHIQEPGSQIGLNYV